ncbi:MAG: glycosyl transferase family 2 [Flavobacteriales bacterium]|nr:glycosyl transferase family 2 [Flavobacteriales bacterium]|tara:strand:+ start:5876 stop:6853 length:978 start_codon:yes stop_codon:yes gene_type:complete
MMQEKVYVTIVTYNSFSETIECLESVFAQDYSNFQIILIDNASDDNSVSEIIKWCNGKSNPINTKFPSLVLSSHDKKKDYIFLQEEELLFKKHNNKLIFVQSKKNNGFAAGNNVGIKYILQNDPKSFCWMLNNDTVVKRNSLLKLVQFQKKNSLGLTGSVLYHYEKKDIVQAVGGKVNKFFGTTSHITNKYVNKIDYVIGASCLISPKVLNSVGLLNEDYFLYYEDVDYSYKIKNQGYKIGFSVESIVYHKIGVSTGANKIAKHRKDDIDLLMLKNRIKFYNRYIKGFFGLYIGFMIVIILRFFRGKFYMLKSIISLLINNKHYD